MTVDDQLKKQLDDFRKDFHRLRTEISRVIVGQNEILDDTLIALIAGGHVLLEGVPGLGKTLTVRTLADALHLDFRRIQFTPDLLPSDVTGTQVLDRQTSNFVMRKGPVFCQLLLADELNRAPARTQSSLLEAMQERQVTIEGKTLPLPEPFMVLATQNPIEQEGVYRLPEAQLDRFLFRIQVGYPSRDQEIAMLDLHSKPTEKTPSISNAEELIMIQRMVDSVFCIQELKGYIIDLVRRSRTHPDLLLGASPRAAIYLMKASRVRALIQGREFMTHEDIQDVALPVLGHRLILRPESEMDGQSVEAIVQQLIQQVPVIVESQSGSPKL